MAPGNGVVIKQDVVARTAANAHSPRTNRYLLANLRASLHPQRGEGSGKVTRRRYRHSVVVFRWLETSFGSGERKDRSCNSLA
jgi:hypothetical protein